MRLGIQLIKVNQFIRDGMSRARPHFCLRLGVALLLVVIGLAGCGGGGQPKSTPTPTPNPSPSPAIKADHVFLVVLENHSFSSVIGSPLMPYLNALAAAHSLAANYFANAH